MKFSEQGTQYGPFLCQQLVDQLVDLSFTSLLSIVHTPSTVRMVSLSSAVVHSTLTVWRCLCHQLLFTFHALTQNSGSRKNMKSDILIFSGLTMVMVNLWQLWSLNWRDSSQDNPQWLTGCWDPITNWISVFTMPHSGKKYLRTEWVFFVLAGQTQVQMSINSMGQHWYFTYRTWHWSQIDKKTKQKNNSNIRMCNFTLRGEDTCDTCCYNKLFII